MQDAEDGGVTIKLARKGAMSGEKLSIYPVPLSMQLKDWFEDSTATAKVKGTDSKADSMKSIGEVKPLLSLPVAAAYVRLKTNFRVKVVFAHKETFLVSLSVK
jgi:hypothetical protein